MTKERLLVGFCFSIRYLLVHHTCQRVPLTRPNYQATALTFHPVRNAFPPHRWNESPQRWNGINAANANATPSAQQSTVMEPTSPPKESGNTKQQTRPTTLLGTRTVCKLETLCWPKAPHFPSQKRREPKTTFTLTQPWSNPRMWYFHHPCTKMAIAKLHHCRSPSRNTSASNSSMVLPNLRRC